MSPGEDPHLEKIVQQLADGAAVDWESASGRSERTPALRGLAVVEKLFRLAQTERRALAAMTLGEETGTGAEESYRPAPPPRAESILATWGSLQLIEKIGEGSYGEVFRAHDPALQIDVALKLWFPRWSSTPDVESFLKEARTLARIRHPNVVTVLGAAHQDERVGMWTELLIGETLEDSLQHRGHFGASEAALVGAELCRALAAVHAAGLVHRDVKSRNIMRVEGGRIVLMDFGSVTQMNRLAAKHRDPFLVGTPLTMAPEQISGQAVGPGTDLYALGVLLYRLVSGHYPIEASTLEELIERHRRVERVPLRDWCPDLSPGFVEIVERALAPLPSDRFASAGAFEQALLRFVHSEGHASRGEEAAEADQSGLSASLYGTPAALTRTAADRLAAAGAETRRTRRAVAATVAVLIAALAAVVVASRLLNPGPPSIGSDVTVTSLQLPFSLIQYPGMSPDGKWIALPAADDHGRWSLYFMNVKGGGPREITSDSGATMAYADISPDASHILYNVHLGNHDELHVVPSLGGASTFVVENASGPHWRPDGERIGYQLDGSSTRSGKLELWSVRPDGTDRRLEYADTLCAGNNRYCFSWSPDGKSIAWVRSFEDERIQEVITHDLVTGRERQLTHDRKNIDEVCWTRQNEILFSSNRGGSMNLWAIRAGGGPAVQVTKGPGPDIGTRVSADGKTVLCLQRELSRHIWIGDLERGLSYQVTHDDASIVTAALSPDHRRIVAVTRARNLSGTGDVIVMDRDGSKRRSIVQNGFAPQSADWSPKGDRIAFTAADTVFVVDANASGDPRRLGAGTTSTWLDANTLYVTRARSSCVMSARDGKESLTSRDTTWAMPLPNGQVLETDDRPGREGVFVRKPGTPLGDPATRRFVAPSSIRLVDVASDGNALLGIDASSNLFWLSLASGARRKAPGNFNGLTLQGTGPYYGLPHHPLGRLALDSREFVYLEPVPSRLLLIENTK